MFRINVHDLVGFKEEKNGLKWSEQKQTKTIRFKFEKNHIFVDYLLTLIPNKTIIEKNININREDELKPAKT